jgi:2-oxoglutarate ferredoxin oxidoreductase subunit beta
MSFDDWYRQDRLPHIFCAGCGNGTIINCTLAAIDQMAWKKEETVFVSGIGCSSRAPGYIATDSLHTTHGRAIAFATGVKMANPELNVVVFTGDGDLAAIGGNHFIHGCRRNIDLTVVCMNNQIYGMTGGQGSPTTPLGCLSSTTPYGCAETPFDLCELAIAAGANYVSRWTSYHVKELEKAVLAGLQTPGFSFIKQVADQVDYLRTHSMLKAKRDRMMEQGEHIPRDIFVVGELARRNRPALGVKP